VKLTKVYFLPARLSKRGICYGNVAGWVAGWLAGWVSVCHTAVLYQNGWTCLKTFSTSNSPIILLSSDPCVDT